MQVSPSANVLHWCAFTCPHHHHQAGVASCLSRLLQLPSPPPRLPAPLCPPLPPSSVVVVAPVDRYAFEIFLLHKFTFLTFSYISCLHQHSFFQNFCQAFHFLRTDAGANQFLPEHISIHCRRTSNMSVKITPTREKIIIKESKPFTETLILCSVSICAVCSLYSVLRSCDLPRSCMVHVCVSSW